MTFPTNPTAGQRHQEPSGIWYTWKACATGGAWEQDRSQLTYYDPIPLGAIQAFTIGTAPRGWLLCDGSTFDQTTYPELFAVLGVATLPDLRGEFLRGREAGGVLGTHVDWTTGKPKTDFISAHSHTGLPAKGGTNWFSNYQRTGGTWPGEADGYNGTGATDSTNALITGGGDAETAPDHTLVDWYIKAAHAKVTLPQSGFQTATTTLHDGDVWQFDAVSNTFKNVPAATLISGMSVGTVAPTAPFSGQQWFDTTPDQHTLKVWDGSSWRLSGRDPILFIGKGEFDNAKVNAGDNWGMPAGTVPDPTKNAPRADDQYLNLDTGRYVRLTGTGSTAIGSSFLDTPKASNYQFSGNSAGWMGADHAKHQIILEGSGQTASDCALWVIAQVNGSWVDWNSVVVQSHANVQFDSGGFRSGDVKGNSEFNCDNGGMALTRQLASYWVAAGKYFHFRIVLDMFDGNNGAFLQGDVEYFSDNSTPFTSKVGAYLSGDWQNKVTVFGVKASTGNLKARMTLTAS